MPKKHHHHRHAAKPTSLIEWAWPALQVIGVLLLASMLKYEWTIMSQCNAEDEYEHSHNLLRLAHSACNEDYYIFAGIIDCDRFRRAIDPAIRAADKAQCWWGKHAIFNSYSSQLVLLGFVIWVIRLVYNYLVTSKKYEYREQERSRRKAAFKMLDYYGREDARFAPKDYSSRGSSVIIEEYDSD
jgi:hypothetical protein